MRQLAIEGNQLAIVVNYNSNQNQLIVFCLDTNTKISEMPNVNSAVFLNQCLVVAAKEKLQMFSFGSAFDKPVREITLSFPQLHEDIEVDYYQIYSLQTVGHNLVAFGAYFRTKDDLESNCGSTMMFWLGEITAKSSMQSLTNKGAKAFFWKDMNHQDDENIPMVKLQSIST